MPKKMSAETILGRLTEVRDRLPAGPPVVPGNADEARAMLRDLRNADLEALSDFELETVLEASQSLADELRTTVEAAQERAFEMALDIYYKAEELVQTGEHPELVEHLENMRAAYERSYGEAVPSRAATEARRKRALTP
ncbi:MAG TPA: hypothetical protein VGF48_11780 [Thermoanaerobaculia bacterium]|jgi:hypothetical protein